MIEVSHLTKKYNNVTVLDNISFSVKSGTITGFVGPNGAGKSTTLRCLVDLTTPTSGSVSILGKQYAKLENPCKLIGKVLDASKLHPSRSGYSTMKIAATILNLPYSRIEVVMNECGLTPEEAKRKVKSYSLGMRQRLCIAQALLGDPKILILDEPINGLDPDGILWFRKFLRKFISNNGTVLISSHILSEMQKIADHIIMIGNGKILADESLETLISYDQDLEDIYMKITKKFSRKSIG